MMLSLFISFTIESNAQKFAIISDIQGATSDSYDVSLLVKSHSPEFIITGGDNHYGTISTIDEQIGQFYSDYIFPYIGAYVSGSTQNNFYPCLGNHDIEGAGFSDYTQYFELPGNERYYDYVKGNVHFFVLNCNPSEADGVSDTSLQAYWLHDHMVMSNSPFNVVYFHFPPYSSSMHGSTPGMRWPFKQWGASIVFSGHDHDYERLLVDSLPYVVCGLGGGPLYTQYTPLPESQFHDSSHHGAVFANATADSITFEFRTTTDSLVDQFTLYHIPESISKLNQSDTKAAKLFSISPNPLNEASVIKFYLPHRGKIELSIHDIYGKCVQIISTYSMDEGIHNLQFNKHQLKAGLYFIKLVFENSNCTQKAIIL